MKIYFLVFIIYLRGLVLFIFNRKHFLIILLRFEFIMLGLFLGLFNNFINNFFNLFFSLIYLTIRVCEGVLGLSVIVIIIRVRGNDYLISFSSLW